jgi:hypothetical protein
VPTLRESLAQAWRDSEDPRQHNVVVGSPPISNGETSLYASDQHKLGGSVRRPKYLAFPVLVLVGRVSCAGVSE